MKNIMREGGTVLDSINTCFTAELLQQISTALNQSPPVVRQGLDRLVPLVVNSLQNWVARPSGGEALWNLTQHAHQARSLAQLATPTAFGGRGVRLMQELLGSTYASITTPLRTATNLPEEAFNWVLEVAVAAVLGTLGQYAADHQLDSTRLGRWLRQQQSVAAAQPLQPTETFVPPSTAPRPTPAPEPPLHRYTVAGAGTWEKVGGGITFTPTRARSWFTKQRRWQLAVAAVLVLGVGYLASLFFTDSEFTPAAAVTAPVTDATAAPAATSAVAASYNEAEANSAAPLTTSLPAGHYDPVTDTYIYTIGQPLVLTLPDGSKQRVGSNSTEYRLYHLLTDPAQRLETQNTPSAWINVDRVYFTAGQASLTAESQQQLQNLASILKAFPQARIKLGGYTDSTGDVEKNLLLSQSRASAAMQALIKLGVDANRLQAEGYGAQDFVASNVGPVGRALNRRLSLCVLNPATAATPGPALAAIPAALPATTAAAASASAHHAKPATKRRRVVRHRSKTGKWFRGLIKKIRGKRTQQHR
ncbi:OmpA family protein [Hymenobacter sp. GOD-10R]|uniref:OmpA family protein n=1 Tax=Hymenobacter sp. GOD-10R TaxID=3093922 RepID=UPI002D76A592|nr:OmpA family protein [Hymenobacter sp. GOD-10R]WRQ27053.1 OmpA family protein [Hymenobacter sp. GOD-10R]